MKKLFVLIIALSLTGGGLVGMVSMEESNLNETYVIPINQIREAL